MKKSLLNSLIPKFPFTSLITLTAVLIIVTSAAIQGQGKETEATGIRTIYLIRHGDYNQEDEQDPDVGKELIPLGIAQARLVATRLKSLPVKITSLISSTMTRARQTAMIINREFPELELQQYRIIRECTPPTWRKDIMERENPEELKNCTDSLEAAFNKFFIPSPDDEDRNDVIVCHGNVIRYFVTKVLKVNTMAWLQMTISNCGLTIVKIMPNGKIKLIAFNDVGHLPPNMQTETGGDNKTKKLLLQFEE
jgi:serine/threonine-protein phosphatase PGAM5